MAVPIFRPTVKRKDMGSVLSCIVSDRLGPGEISRDLVARLSHQLTAAGGVSLMHPYLALSLAFEALGLAAGDRVVLSALGPALCVRVARDRGLVPLLADVDTDSGTIDPKEVEKLMPRGPKAIVAHHTAGVPADVEALKAFGVPVIEDASQGLGGMVGEVPVGGAADLCILSLAPEDVITCGGGAVLLARTRANALVLKRVQEDSPLYSPLADMNAALGISQVQALERFVAARREVRTAYGAALPKSRHRCLAPKMEADPVLAAYPVLLQGMMKEVRAYALKKGVETAPAYTETAISRDDAAEFACPNARSLMLRCLFFPLYPMLSRRDVETVCKVLATIP
jgi:perosamine synthetase